MNSLEKRGTKVWCYGDEVTESEDEEGEEVEFQEEAEDIAIYVNYQEEYRELERRHVLEDKERHSPLVCAFLMVLILVSQICSIFAA